MNHMTGVVRLLKKEQDRLTKELRGIGAALAAFGKTYGKQTGTRGGGRKRRKLSPEAIDRIRRAQRLRWKKFRAAKKKG